MIWTRLGTKVRRPSCWGCCPNLTSYWSNLILVKGLLLGLLRERLLRVYRTVEGLVTCSRVQCS